MPAKAYVSTRTAAQWVELSRGEGFTDIIEHAPEREPIPGVCTAAVSVGRARPEKNTARVTQGNKKEAKA